MPDTATIPGTVAEHARAIADALDRLHAADEEAARLTRAFLERYDWPASFGSAIYAQAETIQHDLEGQSNYDPTRFARRGRELLELVDLAVSHEPRVA